MCIVDPSPLVFSTSAATLQARQAKQDLLMELAALPPKTRRRGTYKGSIVSLW